MRMKRNKKEEGKQNGEEGIEIEENTKKGWGKTDGSDKEDE